MAKGPPTDGIAGALGVLGVLGLFVFVAVHVVMAVFGLGK